jgi:lantibiotic biosynthesis protein
MKKNQEQHSLFSPAPFFMIRTPFLPVDEFFHHINQSDNENYLLSFYAKDETLREAIAIASPNLHEALQNMAEKKGKEREQIVSSLLKYVLRMATRSTPFGLFAFVSQGKWDETTSVIFDHNIIEKRSRPDMEWLFKIIDSICEQPECFNNLPIKANPLLFRSGNRIILNYMRKNETDKKLKNASVSATPLVTTILASAKDSIKMDQLIEKVLEQIPALESEKIRGVILKLLEQQILLFTLLPSLLTESPFQDLLAKLSHYQAVQNVPASSMLKEISLKISAYNGQRKGEQILQEVQSAMKALTPSAHFIQVDSCYLGENLTLNRTVAEELTSTAEVLWRLSCRTISNLNHYHAKFIEKYGARQVPLLELLSEEGLGTPEIYTKASMERIEPSSKEINWMRWLKRECCKCLHERSKEITLTEQLLDKILGPPVDKEKAPLSFDLFCEIIAETSSHIDQGDFLLNISNKTWQAGSTFGRFIDILGENTEESLRHFYFQEEGLEENCLFIESSYLPFSPRYANVANHPNLRSHAIDFGGNSSESIIALEDIIIGSLVDRFYISLKNVNKELIVLAGNVLNPALAPIPLRFLRDVSHARYHSF